MASWFLCAKWTVICCLPPSSSSHLLLLFPASPYLKSSFLMQHGSLLEEWRCSHFVQTHFLGSTNPACLPQPHTYMPQCRSSHQQAAWAFLLIFALQITLQGAVTWDVVPCADFRGPNCFDENSNHILVCTRPIRKVFLLLFTIYLFFNFVVL